MEGMKTIVKLEGLMTIDQLEDFLSGTQAVAFSVNSDKDACYRWIPGELDKFWFLRLPRQGKRSGGGPLPDEDQRLRPPAAHLAGLPITTNQADCNAASVRWWALTSTPCGFRLPAAMDERHDKPAAQQSISCVSTSASSMMRRTVRHWRRSPSATSTTCANSRPMPANGATSSPAGTRVLGHNGRFYGVSLVG